MAENLLMVDDEPDIEELLRQRFRKAIRSGHYIFHFAANGVEALEILTAHPEITVIVTDINMPKMDGLELLQKINEMQNPQMKVIIVSAYGDNENIRFAMNNGAFDFLTKPLDMDDLERTIIKTLQIVQVIQEGLASQQELNDLSRELAAAREIQQSILPKIFPPYPHLMQLDIYGQMEAALQVGGDFFDFFVVDAEHIGFVIGDVSGKGVPSSIFMAVARTLIHSYGMSNLSTSECLKRVNDVLCVESVDSMFVTVFYGILDITNGEIKYTNAGHNYPYILKNTGLIEQLDKGSSIIIGALDDAKFQENTVFLKPKESIVLYTDGVNEAMDKDHHQLGDDTFMYHLQQILQRTNPKAIVDSIFTLVKQHAKGCPQSDDVTVLTITYYGNERGL